MTETDWTIETDEDAEARQRQGAINGRYQVCHPAEGLVGWADTKAEAFRMADDYAERKLPDGRPYCTTPFEVEVYDRMARQGQPRKWLRQPRKGGTYCMEHGDWLSNGARWKCIEKRGVKRLTDDLTSRLWE